MVTKDAHREKSENDNRGGAAHKIQTCSPGFHLCSGLTGRGELCDGLTAEGRSGRADGRAKSPVLKASSVAVVKMAACVSWPTLRADARFRCALTISG